MLRKMTDSQLANQYRRLRMEARPVFNELRRRGYSITEHHGHENVSVTSFENIIISKKTTTRL